MDSNLILIVILAILAFLAIRGLLRRRTPYMRVVVNGKTIHAGNPAEVLAAIENETVVDEPEDPPRELVDGATLPAGVNDLVLELSSVNAEIVHDEAAEAIKFATTYPDHFTGENGTIVQNDFRRTFRASNRDRLVVTVPAGFEGGLTLKVSNSSTVNVDHWRFGEVEIESDGTGSIEVGDLTEIGGLNVTSRNSADISLGDINGRYANFNVESDGDVTAGKITLTGNLDAQLSDDGSFTCGDIKAADVRLNSKDDGDISTGHIESAFEVDVDTGDGETDSLQAEVTIESITAGRSVDLDAGGDYPITVKGEIISENGTVELTTRLDGGISTGDIKSRSVKIRTYDDGDVATGEIDSHSSVAIQTGTDDLDEYMNADVTIEAITAGTEVDIDVGGDHNVTINGDVVVKDGGSVSITTRLDGAASMGDITAGSVAIRTYDDGDVTTGEIKGAGKVSIDTGTDDLDDYMNADIAIASIAAGTRVEIDHGGDGAITIDGGVHVESGSFFVRTQQDGGITINGVTARVVEVESDDDGDIALGDVHSDDYVSATLSADGSVTIGDLTCDSFKGQTDDDGSLTIGAASVHATFTAYANDYGDITVASCVAAELHLTADETGTIYVNAGSAPKVFASGDVRLADSFHSVWERR
jgi:hypothetical protein